MMNPPQRPLHIGLYASSHGNFFFHEIQDLLHAGLVYLGQKVTLSDENTGFVRDAEWHIVVAPHEFFFLGRGNQLRKEVLPKHLVIFNTEQPSTQWFALSYNLFSKAYGIWDINHESSQTLRSRGFHCNFLPLGYLDSFEPFGDATPLPLNPITKHLDDRLRSTSFLAGPWNDRPIDVIFMGTLTPRRKIFFDQARDALARFNCFFHIPVADRPLIPGVTTDIDRFTNIGLLQRSKILLNIHRGDDVYMEWHRIVMHGIWQKLLVISEPCSTTPIFRPGRDYLEVPLDAIVEKIRFHLESSEGKTEAAQIVDQGFQTLSSQCRFSDYLAPLISDLASADIATPSRPLSMFPGFADKSTQARKKRICFVSNFPDDTNDFPSLSHGYLALAEGLAREGHAVTVVHTNPKNVVLASGMHSQGASPVINLSLPAVPHIKFDHASQERILSYLTYLWLKEQDFDLIHFPDICGVGFYSFLAKGQGLAFETTTMHLHSICPTPKRLHQGSHFVSSITNLETTFMEQLCYERADMIFFPLRSNLDWVTAQDWKFKATPIVIEYPLPDDFKQLLSLYRESDIREVMFICRHNDLGSIKTFCTGIMRLSAATRRKLRFRFYTVAQAGFNQVIANHIDRILGQSSAHYSVAAFSSLKALLEHTRQLGSLQVLSFPKEEFSYLAYIFIQESRPFLISESTSLKNLGIDSSPDNTFGKNGTRLSQLLEAVSAGNTPLLSLQRHLGDQDLSRILSLAPPEINQPRTSSLRNTRPKVSVCLVTHDRPDFLSQAVRSLENQDYSHYEVVLVDDGSTKNDHLAYLASLESAFKERGWKIIRQDNKYLGAARNTAARNADGEYLLFMDDDNIAKPHEISTFVKVALHTNADILTNLADTFVDGEDPLDIDYLPRRWLHIGGAFFVGPFMNCFGDANALVRKTVFEAVGGFHEEYGVTHEDYRFFATAVSMGFKLEVVPESLFYYRISKESMIRTTNTYDNYQHSLAPYLDNIPSKYKDIFLVAVGHSITNHDLFSKLKSTFLLLPLTSSAQSSIVLSDNGFPDAACFLIKKTFDTLDRKIDKEILISFLILISKLLKSLKRYRDAEQFIDKIHTFYTSQASFLSEEELIDLKEYFRSNTRIAPKHISDNSTPNRESMQDRDLVSVIILTFNQLKYTKECVESIRKHTVEPHEIIFVDNGSTDGTVKWLRQLTKKNPQYKLIENGTNLGFSRGCNQGIAASSGEYILLLNNDVVVSRNWLSGMIECLNSAPDIGIVGPMTNSISGPQKLENVHYGSMAQMEEFADDFRVRNRHRRIPARRVVGFCMLFRRELAEQIGLLDESFGSGNFEDDDFCLRAVLEGYRNLIAGDVFIHHYGSRSFIGNKIDFSSAMARNRKIFDAKWTAIDPQSTIGKRLLTLIALEKTNELNHKDQIGLAVETCLQAIRHSPEDQNACLALAEVLIDAKRHQDALDVLNEMPPHIQDLRRIELIGYCKEGLELHSEAEEHADRVLSLNPASAAALNLKGILAYKRGDKSTAEGFFQNAIAGDPGYGEPYTNLGVLKWAADQKQEGLALLERGFILAPTLMDISTLYHSAVTTEQQFARAELVFCEAVTLHPMHKRLKFLLIDVLIQQGKYDAAMQLIEEAMVAFGSEDGIVAAALEIRGKIGAKTIRKGSKKKSTLSLCMIVKDEEAHIAKCLASVKPVVDEMIVVDTGSTDRTVDLAKAFGAQVYNFEWTNDFSEARNFSLSKASGDWILVLDADEVVSARDYGLLAKLIEKTGSDSIAYSIITRNYIESVNIKGWTANDGVYEKEEAGTGWQPSKKVRLFTNDKRIRFEGFVHELVEPSLARVSIIPKECNIPIHHYGQLNTTNTLSKGEEYYLLGKAKLRETSGDFQAIVELARQATELGHYADSLILWHRALELRPEDAEAFLNIGYLYLELGRFSEALDASENALRLDPDMKEAALNYSICQLCAGDVKRAVIILEDLLKRIPEYPSAMGVIAAAYCIDGQKDKSLHFMDKIRIKGFDCALTFHDHAKRLIAAGRTNYAISLLETAIENRFANNEILSLLTECHQQRNPAAPSAKTTQFHSPEIQGLTTIILRISKDPDSARECLNSIRMHTKAAHEIILMVGETAGPSVKWARKLAAENRDYEVLHASAGQSTVDATNRAMEQSSGEQIVLLDDRVRVAADWLDGMLECLNSAPDIGIVGPMTNAFGGPQKVEHIHYGSMAQVDEFAADFRVRNRHRRIPARGISGFCMLFRRKLAEQIGFLDASFGSGDLEGYEYCLRASMEGYRTVIAGDVFVHYDGGRSYTGNKMDVSLAMARSKKIRHEKWRSVDVSSAIGKKLIGLDTIEKATEFAHRQQLQEAIQTLTGAIKYASEDKGIYYRLSEILIDAKLFKEALEALQALEGRSKDEPRYLELLGYCHEGLDADDQAESCAERALSLRGNSAPALNLKGVLAHKKGDRSSAEEFFKKSIAADPSYGEPYANLGVLAWLAGLKDEALEFLERGFILSPTCADIINLYHKAITDTAQFGRAEPFFLEVQTIYPHSQRVAFLLIDLLIQQQKYPEALHEIQRAMLTFGIDDGIITAALEVLGKIETTEMKGKSKGKATLSLAMIVKNEEEHIAKCLWSAIPIADEIIVVDTGSTDRTKEIAKVFGAQVYTFKWNNDFSEARNYSLSLCSCEWILILDADEVISPIDHDHVKKIVKSSISKPIAYKLITRTYTNRLNVDRWNANDGEYPLEEAGNGWYPSDKVRLFKRDQRIRFVNPIHESVDPTIIEAGIKIKSCPIPIHHYGRLGSCDKIQEKRKAYYLLSKKKAEEKGDDQHALYELALVAAELERYDEAIELWGRFFQLDATMPPEFIHSAYVNMGSVYAKLGRYQEALDVSKKVLELNPALKEAVVNHANCMIWLEDAEKVIAPLEGLVQEMSDYIPALCVLAVAYLLCGQAVKGQDCLKDLRKRGFDTAAYLLDQAKILRSLKKIEYARTLLEAALQIRDDQEAMRLLDECVKSINGVG